MKAVSNAYKKSMAGLLRECSYAKIYFGNIDAEAAEDGAWVSNGEMPWSSFDTVDYRYAYGPTAATLEWNRWMLDGTQTLVSDGMSDGFVSDRLSGADGAFDSACILSRQFEQVHMFPGVTLTFDSRTDEWPASVTVMFFLNDELVHSSTIGVTSAVLALETDVDEADRIEIIFNMALPYRRPRVEYIIYGIGREYTNDEIVALTQTHDVDPLSRRLPSENFSFTILDYRHLYDPDNPEGIYRFVEINSPVSVKYGYTLPDGHIEWLKEDNYLLDAQPEVENNQATFSATGLIGSLTDTFYKSRLGRKSFYDMAEEVLLDADLTPTPAGEHPWLIDESLKDMYTTAVLPIDTHMNCLQLIAHACRCCLYTDDDNVIHIEPFGVTVAGIFSGKFSDNGHTDYSEWASVNSGTSVQETYATLEWNRWELGEGSRQVIVPDGEAKPTGYVSSQLSGADGIFSDEPAFRRTFDVKNDLPVVGLTFDGVLDEHPTAVEVRYYDGDELLDTQAAAVNDTNYVVLSGYALNCSRIEVTCKGTLPYYRFRVSKVYYKQTDFSLTFDNIHLGTQRISKIDKLKNVTVAKSIYTPNENVTKLYEAATDEESLHIEFRSIAENLTVELSSGAVESVAAYGRAVDLKVSPGMKTITISGNIISESTAVKTYNVSNSGETDVEENPLITDDGMRDALAEHISTYLQMRNTYDVEYRGNPELETRDIIGYQTAYTDELYALILTDEITFDGSLHGSVKVKGLLNTGDYEAIRIITVVSPTGSGAVSGGGNYDVGDLVTLTARPAAGYRFSYWMEGGRSLGSSPTLEFIASGSRRLTAVFAAIERYTVNLFASPDGGGTVSGDGAYEGGTEITVTATEASGYTFVGWQENGVTVSESASYTFTVTDSRALTAVFSAVLYNIIISASPTAGGTVSGGGQLRENSTASLLASASSGYRFAAWQENGTTVSESATYTFTVTGDRTLVAVFKARYTVTVTADPAGYGTASGGGTYDAGDTVTLKAAPYDGYDFVGWSVDGAVITTEPEYIFYIHENISAVAVFRVHVKALARKETDLTLSAARSQLAAAKSGTYVLFAGGNTGTQSAVVDAFSTGLTRTLPETLSTARNYLSGASVGSYAIFAGGRNKSGGYYSTVDAYSGLTRTTAEPMSKGRGNYAAGSNGAYAVFAGGFAGESIRRSDVDAYDAYLTHSTAASLETGRNNHAAAGVGQYVLFAGGIAQVNGSVKYMGEVNAYDRSLTRQTPAAMATGRSSLAGASVGEYALFAGGISSSNTYSGEVTAYDASLTRQTVTALSIARGYLSGVSMNDHAVFGGGADSSATRGRVDGYDATLTRSTTELSVTRNLLAADAAGNIGFFGGGHDGKSVSSVVDVFVEE